MELAFAMYFLTFFVANVFFWTGWLSRHTSEAPVSAS